MMRTDAAGRFAADRLGAASQGRSAGRIEIEVERSGFLPVEKTHLGRFRSDDGEHVVVLRKGLLIKGRVVEEANGVPVAGAEVALGRFASNGRPLVLGPLAPRWREGLHLRQARADSQGAFEFTAPPGVWDLLVRADGRAQRQLRGVAVGESGVDLGEIGLSTGQAVRGVVLDDAGVPVSNARVLAVGRMNTGALAGVSALDLSNGAAFETDSEGRFVVPGLAGDARVDVRVFAPGFAVETVENLLPNERPVEIALLPEASIVGHVTLDGRPAPEIPVRVRPQEWPYEWPLWSAQTDAEGRFAARNLREGRYNVEIGAREESSDPWRGAVTARAGETAELDIELESARRDRSLHGRIVARGVGLADVEVQVGDVRSVTGGDGRYRIAGLTGGSHGMIVVREGRVVRRRVVTISGRTKRQDFDLTRHPVEGKAFWDDGSPASSTRIRFAPRQAASDSETLTSADGSFLVRLEAGEYEATTTSSGRRAVFSDRPIHVRGPVSDARVRFLAPLRIEGIVHGLSRGELTRLRVQAGNADFELVDARVDGTGRFMIEGLSAGLWGLIGTVGSGERRVTREVRLRSEDAWVELEFERGFELAGAARLDGEPLRSVEVLLLRTGDPLATQRAQTLHNGSFRFTDLDRGRYRVAVGATIREVTVNGDERLEIELWSGSLRGFAVDPEVAQPLAGSEIRLWPREASHAEAEALGIVRRTFTSEAGEFLFERVPAGPWVLEATGLPGARRQVQVGPGAVAVQNLP